MILTSLADKNVGAARNLLFTPGSQGDIAASCLWIVEQISQEVLDDIRGVYSRCQRDHQRVKITHPFMDHSVSPAMIRSVHRWPR